MLETRLVLASGGVIDLKFQVFKLQALYVCICMYVYFCRASDTRRLERVQERGLRAVFKDKQSSHKQLLAKAKLPSLYK